jgi:hypothetical protein
VLLALTFIGFVFACIGVAILEWGIGAALDPERRRARIRRGPRADISNLH